MIGDTIEFAPGTDAEAPWLFDADGSQLDGGSTTAAPLQRREQATYRFTLPEDVTGGTLTLDIANEFLVEVSTDNATWRTVLRGDRAGARPGNREERTLDLNELRAGGRTLYVRLGDAKPDEGWGGWLAHVRLVMER